MKPVYQLLAVLMLLGAPAYSQSVLSVDNLKCANSIIRTIGSDEYLLYNIDQWGNSRFVYYSTAGLRSFPLPSGMKVSDVEIDTAGNAWFCGNQGGNGVAGVFSVAGVFTGMSAVHYALFAPPPYPFPQFYPCELNRLDLAYRGDTTVVAMVGGMQNLYDSRVYPAVVSTTFDGSTSQWTYCYRYNKDRDKVYTDIAVLEDVIVAAAIDSLGHNSYLKVFKKVSCFTNYPLYDQQMSKITIPTVQCNGPLLITRDSMNTIATIQYTKSPYSIVSFLVDPINSPSTIIRNFEIDLPPNPPVLGFGDIREIRHCDDTTIFALHHGYHNGQTSTCLESWMLAIHEGYNNSSIMGYELHLGYAHSLDNSPGIGPTVCGSSNSSNYLTFSNQSVFSTPACHWKHQMSVTHYEAITESVSNGELYNSYNESNKEYYPEISVNNKTSICP